VRLVNEELFLLGDVAFPLGPGLVRDWLANDVNGPRHGFANLDRDYLQVVSYKPWLHCSLGLHFLLNLLVFGFHFWRFGLFYRQFRTRFVLPDTLADDRALVGDPGVEDGQPVHALVQRLDLDPVVLLHRLPGNHPLCSAVLVGVGHLAFKCDFFLDVTFLILQRLEELVDGSHPQGHLCLVAVRLALKQSCSFARNIIDDKHPLAAVFKLLDLVKPVGVALEDLNALVVPVDVAFFVVHLAGDSAGAMLNLAETLQLAGEVARSVFNVKVGPGLDLVAGAGVLAHVLGHRLGDGQLVDGGRHVIVVGKQLNLVSLPLEDLLALVAPLGLHISLAEGTLEDNLLILQLLDCLVLQWNDPFIHFRFLIFEDGLLGLVVVLQVAPVRSFIIVAPLGVLLLLQHGPEVHAAGV